MLALGYCLLIIKKGGIFTIVQYSYTEIVDVMSGLKEIRRCSYHVFASVFGSPFRITGKTDANKKA